MEPSPAGRSMEKLCAAMARRLDNISVPTYGALANHGTISYCTRGCSYRVVLPEPSPPVRIRGDGRVRLYVVGMVLYT